MKKKVIDQKDLEVFYSQPVFGKPQKHKTISKNAMKRLKEAAKKIKKENV